jgi:16S rRNA (guanine966-N2)-methyltransferase
VRVIAGRLGGRRLHAARGRSVRPTADRVRESLFSILGHAVVDARILDLYAGTGALAIEALSRGGRRATCIERDARAIAALERNIAELGLADRVEVARADALDFARRLEGGPWLGDPTHQPNDGTAYDVVLCDPPYRAPLAPLAEAVLEKRWWKTVAVIEHSSSTEPPAPAPGTRNDTRRYGDTAITLYWRR